MKQCTQCKGAVVDEARFCQFCGTTTFGAITAEAAPIQKETSLHELLESRSDGFFTRLWDEIKTLRLSTIFPVKVWWKDRPWSLVWVKWFLFFGFFPLCLINIYGNENIALSTAAWALGIYFSLLWAFVFRICILPQKVGAGNQAKVVFFTMLLSAAIIFFLLEWSLFQKLYDLTNDSNFFYRMIGFIVGVGLVEESVKALPVYLFIYRKKLDLKPSTYAFVGALSGLAFGVSEAVAYSIIYASGHATQKLGYGDYIVVQVLRLVSLPLLHALWSGIVGYFIGLARMQQKTPRALMSIGVGIAVLLHGFYDLFSDSWIGMMIGAASLIIFISYIRSQGQMSNGMLKDVVLTPPTNAVAPVIEKSAETPEKVSI